MRKNMWHRYDFKDRIFVVKGEAPPPSEIASAANYTFRDITRGDEGGIVDTLRGRPQLTPSRITLPASAFENVIEFELPEGESLIVHDGPISVFYAGFICICPSRV